MVLLSAIPPGSERGDRESVSQFIEEREAEVGASDVDCDAACGRPAEPCVLFEQRGGLLDAAEVFHAGKQTFIEAVGAASLQLEVGGPHHGVDHPCSRAGEAAVCDEGREDEGHSDHHPDAGEQLLGAMHAQTVAVDVEERVRSHQGTRPQGRLRKAHRRRSLLCCQAAP